MFKIEALWQKLRDTTWIVPTALALLAVGLAFVMVRVDAEFVAAPHARDAWWLYGGDAEGARSILSTIAVGLLSITGVLFSVTIVALQLTSSQFTPRVLQNFTEDRSTQVVLGVFIGTAAYALLVLAEPPRVFRRLVQLSASAGA